MRISHKLSTMAQKRSKNQIRRERAKLRKVETGTPSAADVLKEPVSTVQKPENPTENGHIERSSPLQPGKKTPISSEEETNNTAKNGDAESKLHHDSESAIPPPESKIEPDLEKQHETTGLVQVPDSLMEEFASVFEKFQAREELGGQLTLTSKAADSEELASDSGSDSDSVYESDSEQQLSKRQLRKKNRVPIAELKAATDRPQAVEWFDVDAPDPFLVVKLKTMANAVDVPTHWQQKKEYLSSKRGVERPPFKLPKYIEDTGISEMRNHEADSLKKLQRDRVQPKMGKLDIDYQKLHDAFFKFQTKPKLLGFGELYYEGREKADVHRDQIKHMRPGKISRALRAAVGLPENENAIPPWIVLMNELGKPPAYADCVIPGVDIEYSNLGYKLARDAEWESLDISESLWGHMEEGEESEEELESEEEEEEDEAGEEPIATNVQPDDADDDQPEKVDITEYSRIKGSTHIAEENESSTTSGNLYTVLKEKSMDASKSGLVEGQQGYEMKQNGDEQATDKKRQVKATKTHADVEDFKF